MKLNFNYLLYISMRSLGMDLDFLCPKATYIRAEKTSINLNKCVATVKENHISAISGPGSHYKPGHLPSPNSL